MAGSQQQAVVVSKERATMGFEELGRSGLTHFHGIISEEQMRDLRGVRGVKTYQKMADYDDTIGAALLAITTLIKSASFRWVAASEQREDQMRREFMEQVWRDMSQTWDDLLGDILTYFTYGWSYFEIVLKRRNGQTSGDEPRSMFTDGRIGLRKIAIRAQQTLDRWAFDDHDGIQGLYQCSERGAPVLVPIQKSLLFRTSTTKNNPEGRSLLRNAWQSWYFKSNIRTIEGIGVERDLAGYPMIELQEGAPDIYNTKDSDAVALKASLEETVRGIRRDEQEGAIMPYWAKLSLLSSGGRRNFDTNEIITRYDQRICMSLLADFIMIGHDAVGSKALSSTKIGVLTKALSGFATSICEIINRFLVPKLMSLNGWGDAQPPTFEPSNIMTIEIGDVAKLIDSLVGGGATLFPDPELEKSVLTLVGLQRAATPIIDPETGRPFRPTRRREPDDDESEDA